MDNNISLIETDLIAEKVQIILRQTDYTKEIAAEKLKLHNFNEIAVIKAYFGITEKPPPKITSVNQEIYKQLRYRLDSNNRDYQNRVKKGEVKKIV